MEKRGRKSKYAQIWVETVIYTLIGLTVIGIVIAVSTPKIKQMYDKAVIEQTITALNNLNQKAYETQRAAGNSRIVEFRIKQGELKIDSRNDTIYFILKDTGLRYSSENLSIRQGDIIIKTYKKDKKYEVDLILDYSSKINITYENQESDKTLTSAPSPYSIMMENKGGGILDISLV